MSPTARNRNSVDFQHDVFPIMRTQQLEASELQALYGDERDDYSSSPVDGEGQTEEDLSGSDEYIAEDGVNEFTYLAGQSPHTQPYLLTADTHLHRKVFFSNETYYSKLEELKRVHLKKIADLQRLYLDQLTSRQTDRGQDDQEEQINSEQVVPRHQENVNPSPRIINSDQSDACEEKCVFEQEDHPEWKNTYKSPHVQQQVCLTPPTDDPPQRKWCPLLKGSSSLSLANQQPQQAVWAETQRRGSKVTVPQPFQMTLREEERKLRRVKTRSEVELENERLRKELDELKECGKKFRAMPAPASTYLPLYEVINMRLGQRQPAKEKHVDHRGYHEGHRLLEKPPGHRLQDKSSSGCRLQEKPSAGCCPPNKPSQVGHLQERTSLEHNLQDKSSQGGRHQNRPSPRPRRNVPPLPQEPFSFIERERKKKEMKLQAELNSVTPREERRVFKARPVPKSLYRRTSQDFHVYGAISLHSRMQEHRRSITAPPGCLEESLQEETPEDDEENEGGENSPPFRGWGEKKQSTEKMEKETERRRIGERDWSYIHPLRRASVSRSQEVLAGCKSEYISF